MKLYISQLFSSFDYSPAKKNTNFLEGEISLNINCVPFRVIINLIVVFR